MQLSSFKGFALHPSSRFGWFIHPTIFAYCLDALHCLTRLVLTNPENDTEEKTQNVSNLAVLRQSFLPVSDKHIAVSDRP